MFVPFTRVLVSVLAGGCLAVSCQKYIFEDRTLCPSFVYIKTDPPINPVTWDTLVISIWEDGRRLADRTATAFELNQGFDTEATKNSYFEASLLGGWPEEWHGDGYLYVPEGNECAEGIGAFFGLPIGTDEFYQAPLTLTYLYADLVFVIKGASAGYRFNIETDGIVDGFLYPGFGLHYGPFHAKASEAEYLRRKVRIPRQVPFGAITKADGTGKTEEKNALDGLTATVSVENVATGKMGRYVTIPVGKAIKVSPYDWSRPFLEEIVVEITMFEESVASVKVSIAGWEKVIIGGSNGNYNI